MLPLCNEVRPFVTKELKLAPAAGVVINKVSGKFVFVPPEDTPVNYRGLFVGVATPSIVVVSIEPSEIVGLRLVESEAIANALIAPT